GIDATTGTCRVAAPAGASAGAERHGQTHFRAPPLAGADRRLPSVTLHASADRPGDTPSIGGHRARIETDAPVAHIHPHHGGAPRGGSFNTCAACAACTFRIVPGCIRDL